MADNCSPCTDCTSIPTGPVCPDPPQYTAYSCPDTPLTDCVLYSGPDNSCLGVSSSGTPMTLTNVLNRLFSYITTLFGRITSSSLSVNRSGACADNVTIELVPSSQSGNILTIGNDGKPYVPQSIVTMQSSKCITYVSTGPAGAVIWIPILDFQCIATNITSFAIACTAPAGVAISGVTTNSAIVSFGTSPGLTYDVLLNNLIYATNVSSPLNITGLSPSSSYSVTVRVHCVSGDTAETVVAFTTQQVLTCNTPTNLTITSV